MEVILIENVDKLGSRGQLVKVADGYGRNYLLPKKIAVAATPQNRKWLDQQRVRFLKLEAKEKADAGDLAQLLDGVRLAFLRKSGEHGALFGSVTAIDIAEGLSGLICWHFHYANGAPGGCQSGLAGGWHTFGVDWEPGSITWYYDGTPVGTVTSGVTGSPMYLIADLALDDTYGGPIAAPATLRIDYIRVWQR